MPDRTLLRVTGADRLPFLQGLVTNDVDKLAAGPIYTALLTPQGKYFADFFLIQETDAILIDVDAGLAASLLQRLTMYKLRADVAFEHTKHHLHKGLNPCPEDGWNDPRHPALGWRAWRAAPSDQEEQVDWTALHVTHVIPQSGEELTPDTYILEAGFERLNGVDFRKGCYVGQEVTARMKHKTTLRKGLAQVEINGSAAPGTEITTNGKPIGRLHSRTGDRAIAYLRFDRVAENMQAGEALVRLVE